MPTVLDENNPLNTNLAGEQDDHMRAMKIAVKTLFEKGHFLSDPQDASVDGQLKFGERVATPTYASSVTLDLSDGTIQVVQCTSAVGDCTLTFSDPPDDGLGDPVDGFGFVLIVKQDGTGGRDVTWPASVLWVNGADPYQNTDANAETHYSFYTVTGSAGASIVWYGMVIGDFNV